MSKTALKNRSVIISGGSSGIGLASAIRFSQAGYTVFILDITAPKTCIPSTHFIHCDVSQITDINQAVVQIDKTGHPISALVCNAGIHLSATLLETSEMAYEQVMAINLKGCFFLTQAVLPHMIAYKKGTIVFVGSDQTLVAKPHSVVYGMTKAALASLCKTTAIDYAKQGIRANLVAVGTIDTPLYQKAVAQYCQKTQTDIQRAHITEAEQLLVGRIGKATEVADLIYFLCSKKARFITGAIFPIDGGYTAYKFY